MSNDGWIKYKNEHDFIPAYKIAGIYQFATVYEFQIYDYMYLYADECTFIGYLNEKPKEFTIKNILSSITSVEKWSIMSCVSEKELIINPHPINNVELWL
jgi:hypothetical protein